MGKKVLENRPMEILQSYSAGSLHQIALASNDERTMLAVGGTMRSEHHATI